MLFHIVDRQQWNDAVDAGSYRPERYEAEGFIHLSEQHQVLTPANAIYHGRSGLVLLVIDPSTLLAEVIYEPGALGEDELFPHLYGELNPDAVVGIVDFPPEPDGTFRLPDGLSSYGD